MNCAFECDDDNDYDDDDGDDDIIHIWVNIHNNKHVFSCLTDIVKHTLYFFLFQKHFLHFLQYSLHFWDYTGERG